jgi:hypothetical protein
MKRPARLSGALAALLGGIAVIAAPIASADSTDDTFLGALNQAGISFPNLSDQGVVKLGHLVCKDWTDGLTAAQVVADVQQGTGLTEKAACFFVGAASQSYCPKYVN